MFRWSLLLHSILICFSYRRKKPHTRRLTDSDSVEYFQKPMIFASWNCQVFWKVLKHVKFTSLRTFNAPANFVARIFNSFELRTYGWQSSNIYICVPLYTFKRNYKVFPLTLYCYGPLCLGQHFDFCVLLPKIFCSINVLRFDHFKNVIENKFSAF